jgi:uncharacterized protein YaaN involved in tellurite resistance
MKKILGSIFMIVLFTINAKCCICCGSSGCLDAATIPPMGTSTEEFFHGLDEKVANQIDKIKEKINESHAELEKDSKTILENTRKLNRRYYIVSQDILHNQILINELQSLLTDAIASNAEAKKGKNALDVLKQGVEK